MLKGLYDAAAGMKARLMVQDIIASNLANAGTSGFQRQVTAIQSQTLAPASAPAAGPDGSLIPSPSAYAPGTAMTAAAATVRSPREVLTPISAPDTRQCVLQQTGSSTDVALDGPGYLMVSTPRGPRLVRGGPLHPNARGDLATLSGDPLLSTQGKAIAVGDKTWQVAPDGTVTAAASMAPSARTGPKAPCSPPPAASRMSRPARSPGAPRCGKASWSTPTSKR